MKRDDEASRRQFEEWANRNMPHRSLGFEMIETGEGWFKWADTEDFYLAWADDSNATAKAAAAMIECSLATGHGDTLDDLLGEMKAQVDELRQRLVSALPVPGLGEFGARVAPGCATLMDDERAIAGQIRRDLFVCNPAANLFRGKAVMALLDIIDRLIGEQHCDNCGAPMHFDQEECSQCG